MNKYFFFTLLALVLFINLNAAISIQVKGDKLHNLAESTINDVAYVDVDDLAPAFKSITKQDRSDQRLYLHMYGESFIFLESSPYYSFKLDSYNMRHPMLKKGTKYFLPSSFLLDCLSEHFGKSISVKGRSLSISKPDDRSINVIVLDPGHGGKDPGAVGKKLKAQEKDINLAVALKLKQVLEKELGITVLMTRSDDRFVSLGDRTRFANDRKADMFVSIHTNASKDPKPHGAETYYLSTAVTSDARAVEALENQVVELYEGGVSAKRKYDDLDFILSDLSQTEHLESSNSLAGSIQQHLVAGSRAYDRGVKQANFYVLRGAFMPSILIELGFISNPEEEALLINPEYQDRLAKTIFEGIKRFKFRYDRIRNT